MTRSRYTAAQLARDDGLRRVRKITWRIGLLATAAAAVVFARFAHIVPSLPHLTSGRTGGPATSTGQSSSSGIPSSSGVSPGTGGGQAVSGGS